MVTGVLVAEDQPLMRDALRRYVDAAADLTCAGEATDGLTAVRLADQLAPDVVLMDIKMPNLDGIRATAQISLSHPEISVLAITTFTTEHHVVQMLRAGARGFIGKDAPASDVMNAIRSVASGEVSVPASIMRDLVLDVSQSPGVSAEAFVRSSRLPEVPRSLSQVLHQLAKGRSNAEIADSLVLAEDTVKKYMARLNELFGTRDRVQLLIRATQLGCVEPSLDRAD